MFSIGTSTSKTIEGIYIYRNIEGKYRGEEEGRIRTLNLTADRVGSGNAYRRRHHFSHFSIRFDRRMDIVDIVGGIDGFPGRYAVTGSARNEGNRSVDFFLPRGRQPQSWTIVDGELIRDFLGNWATAHAGFQAARIYRAG